MLTILPRATRQIAKPSTGQELAKWQTARHPAFGAVQKMGGGLNWQMYYLGAPNTSRIQSQGCRENAGDDNADSGARKRSTSAKLDEESLSAPSAFGWQEGNGDDDGGREKENCEVRGALLWPQYLIPPGSTLLPPRALSPSTTTTTQERAFAYRSEFSSASHLQELQLASKQRWTGCWAKGWVREYIGEWCSPEVKSPCPNLRALQNRRTKLEERVNRDVGRILGWRERARRMMWAKAARRGFTVLS
ncbi:hypothetical protein C8J57DRAFT_1620972 [Mycena rebaudengoi]|nr:hypothetical protein C8J57DRAFT_1620972 [Mycena rebaudengoi]